MPGVGLSRSQLDNSIYARHGWSIFADVHGAAHNALSTVSFVQAHATAKFAYPIRRRSRVLLRYEYGANWVEDFGKLPASQRFFAGGDDSIRGYDYKSIGPKDSKGEGIGGNFLTSVSAQSETRVR